MLNQKRGILKGNKHMLFASMKQFMLIYSSLKEG